MADIRCFVCGIDENANGDSFIDECALSLHIAGKAMTWNDAIHTEWIRELPFDTGLYDINNIDSAIRPHVIKTLRKVDGD